MQRVGDLGFPDPGAAFDSELQLEIPLEVERALTGLALAVNHGLQKKQLQVFAFELRDLDVALLRRACAALGNTERFWPKPVDIRECVARLAREDAAEAYQRALAPLPDEVQADPRLSVYCRDCQDQIDGWRLFWCPGGGSSRNEQRVAPSQHTPYYCGRKLDHGPHAYTERCGCRDTNPVANKKREAMARGRDAKQAQAGER